MPAPIAARRARSLAGTSACLLLLVASITLPARAETSADGAAAANATPSREDSAPAQSDAGSNPGEQAVVPGDGQPVPESGSASAGPDASTTTSADGTTTADESEEKARAADAPAKATASQPSPTPNVATGAETKSAQTPENTAVSAPPPAVTRPVPPPTPAPKPVMHDIAIETGWQNPTGTGLRYLFVLPSTTWSIGAGLGVTTWGRKLSLGVRRADDVTQGAFFQAGLGLVDEQKGVQRQITVDGRSVTATFDFTAGRTVDLSYGWRWALPFGYVEAAAHWSINLLGTVLQRPTNGELFTIDEETRESLLFGAPGGLGVGAAYGVQF